MKQLNRICPICGCNHGKVLNTISMVLPHKFNLTEKYDVVACNDCGFTFADTISSQEDFNNYYATCNMYSANGEVKKDDTLNHIRHKLFNKYVECEKRVLDIGCGDGGFLLYLKEHGYGNVYGIDPSELSIRKLKDKNIDGSLGNIFDGVPKALQKAFDVVVCTAVIEHVYSLDTFVSHLKEYLVDEGGMLFIDAPAVEGFEKYILSQPNYFNHEHINYFSLISLDNLLHLNSFGRINSNKESYCLCGVQSKELGLQGIYTFSSECDREQIKDVVSEKSISNYFELIKKNEEKEKTKLKEFLKKNEKIIIWGTGSYTMQFLAKYPELQEKTQFFIDNNETKFNMILCGKRVYSAVYLLENHEKYPILICSMMNSKDIVKQIKKMGISNPYYMFS